MKIHLVNGTFDMYRDLRKELEDKVLHGRKLNALNVFAYSHHYTTERKLTQRARMLFGKVFQLFNKMETIGSNNYKQAWIKVPRGSVMDSGFESEQEAFDYYEVDNKADLEKAFLEAFPNEYYWFQITSITYETHQMLQLGDLTFYLTNGEIDCYSDKYRYCDLFVWMIDALEEVIKECEAGTYNDRIEKELPYELRYGVISRKILWDHNPKYRESNLQDLTKEEIDRFIAILEEEGGQCPTERLKSITFNRYFRYASKAYKNAGLEVEGMTPYEQFMRHGEDFGGRLLEDADKSSTKGFYKFFKSEKRMGGHPWGLLRGSSRSRIFLRPHFDKDGCYFTFSGDPNWSVYELVKMYLALKDSGMPVGYVMPKETITYLREEDNVGFVKSTELCVYCQTSFDEPINDFYHYHEENDAPIKHLVEWYPVEKVTLKKDGGKA